VPPIDSTREPPVGKISVYVLYCLMVRYILVPVHPHAGTTVETPPGPEMREQIEANLLAELRQAETEFKQANFDQREPAERKFREALRRFSEFVLR